jgi:hypothetical protein
LTFRNTTIRVSRPAVVIEFNSGAEKWEIIPGYRKATKGDSALYDIPGVGTVNWMESAPIDHLAYVNAVNQQKGIEGGAKKLARLTKAWKYFNDVPISSFYLEMRAAKYLSKESFFEPFEDITRLLESLANDELAAMNDPMEVTSRFHACSTDAKRTEALSKIASAAVRARKALNDNKSGKVDSAFTYLDLVFGNRFPSR